MSDMLEQAIVDAEALKDAALKNAEKMIVEKYSSEIKEAVKTILEQPEEDLGLEDEEEEETPKLPRADLDGEDIEGVATSEDGKIEVDLGKLAEELAEEEEEGEVDASDMVDREEEVAPELKDSEEEFEEGEEFELDEEALIGILEKLTVDVKPVPTGQAGGASNQTLQNELEDILLAQDGEKEDADYVLKKSDDKPVPTAREKELEKKVESLTLKGDKLFEQNKKYKELLLRSKDKLHEVNLSNARLLYTNRVLGSTSLNERQKTKIVEALSNAGSVEEAKVIFDTLQSTVGSERKRSPQSLNEAVRRSSTTLPKRNEAKAQSPVQDRWKVLAGIS
jgi:hypothetical protein